MTGNEAVRRGSCPRAQRRRRELGAAESFAEACRWLPLAIGLPFALMFFAGVVFGWI